MTKSKEKLLKQANGILKKKRIDPVSLQKKLRNEYERMSSIDDSQNLPLLNLLNPFEH